MHPHLASLLGGALIGLSASLLLLFNGKTAGISNMASGLLPPWQWESGWRPAFLAGLLGGGAVLAWTMPATVGPSPLQSPLSVAFAGLLVGFGTRWSNGCTSGHGICGVARGAKRSLLATATFIATGAVTVFVVRHLLRGAP
jgi:uncharacterized membrane protein YedE/YeeE